MTIKILPEYVTNQIAAGEVVEGPSSIVKELVENSIDADASKIVIELSNQMRTIKVSDNGQGMSPGDLDLAFKRHATSKIETVDDIYSLTTNGFRGEALASIASVSKVTCISKRESDEHASKLCLVNGLEEKSLTGASHGTSMLIDDLFFNTPVRLKFLKSNKRERDFVTDTVRSLALSRPDISFTLKIDDKQIFKTTGTDSEAEISSIDLKRALGEVFSPDILEGLNEVKFHAGDIRVSGFVSSPQFTRSDKRGMFTILNHRAIKCYIIRSAIESAYKALLSPGKYPFAVIFVDMPHENVDVNVHPTKKEVKYKDANKVFVSVGDAVAKALSDSFYERSDFYQVHLDTVCHSRAGENPGDINANSQLTILESPVKPGMTAIESSNNCNRGYGIKENFNFENLEANQFEKLGQQSRKFISRFGAVDISVIDSTQLRSVISSQGNKTNFEIVSSSEKQNKSVFLRGDFVGENWIKDRYLSFVQQMANEVLEKVVVRDEIKPSFFTLQKRPPVLKKPGKKILEEVWERDNYTCVYCHKTLLHPDTVKEALPRTKTQAFRVYLNKQNKKISINVLSEHVASYDHHLPASKFAQLNTDIRNLYTSCIGCNMQKSDSLAHKTWQPNPGNSWLGYSREKPFKLAGLEFSSPKNF